MQYNCKSWPFRSLCSTAPNPEHSGLYAVQLQILSIQILMQYNSKSWAFRSLCSTTPNPGHSGPYAVQLQILSIQILTQYNSRSWALGILIQYNSKSWPFRSLCSTAPNPEHAESLYSTTPNPEDSDPYTVQHQILTTWDPYTIEGLSIMWRLLNIIILPSCSLLDHLCLGEFPVKSARCVALINWNQKQQLKSFSERILQMFQLPGNLQWESAWPA